MNTKTTTKLSASERLGRRCDEARHHDNEFQISPEQLDRLFVAIIAEAAQIPVKATEFPIDDQRFADLIELSALVEQSRESLRHDAMRCAHLYLSLTEPVEVAYVMTTEGKARTRVEPVSYNF